MLTSYSDKWNFCSKRLFLLAEGFEDRAFAFLEKLTTRPDALFAKVVLCQYLPEAKPDKKEFKTIFSKLFSDVIVERVPFHRFAPSEFEMKLKKIFAAELKQYDEIVIDISAMSKLIIMIIFQLLKESNVTIRVIYSEPENYSPSQKTYNIIKKKYGENITSLSALPSFGVFDVVRTPELSSVVMQQNPKILIAFTSFNELLIRALMSTISPMHLYLISSAPPRLCWRENATQELHEKVIEDFSIDNPKNEHGCLIRRCSTLDYREAFVVLAGLYRSNCYDYRIILAPTGSKMQALGAAIVKCCCPDIHIEYPTPHSYHCEDFSSRNIHAVHEIVFNNYASWVINIADEYRLNG